MNKEREIKFRAWSKSSEKMYKLETLQLEFGSHCANTNICGATWLSRNSTILMQYTGIKDNTKWNSLTAEEQLDWVSFDGNTDKNWKGKEIYEGDIVKTRKQNRLRDIMKYGLNGKMLENPTLVVFENAGFYPLNCWIDEAIKNLQFKVIGNVYENKELLK